MDRDLDAMKVFCNKFRAYCDNLTSEAISLNGMANDAEGALRDEVGQAAADKVREFAAELKNIADMGEERILELVLKIQRMEEDMIEAKGKMR